MQKNQQPSITLLGFSIWLLAALFFLYEFFLRTFVGSVAHQIIPDLHLNAETFALIGSAYYVAYGVMQIPVGVLADKFGVKWIMIFATLVCAIATLLFAHANHFISALTYRMLMGLGSSFAFVCLLVIAITWFPRKYFGLFAGLSQFIGTMGPLLAAGPLVTVLIRSHSSWRTILNQIGFAGLLLTLCIFLIVKEKPRETKQTLIYLQKSEQLSARLGSLLRNKQAWYIALYSAMVYISIALLGAFWGTEYLQACGLSQSDAANIISLAWLGYAIGCPLIGALSDLTRKRKPYLILCSLMGFAVTTGITYFSTGHPWLYSLLFFGLGIAAAGQNIGFAIISENTDVTNRASALGLNNCLITSFGAFIPPIASLFINTSASNHSGTFQPHDFILGFCIMPILNGLALLISTFLIKETFCKPQKELIILNKLTHLTSAGKVA